MNVNKKSLFVKTVLMSLALGGVLSQSVWALGAQDIKPSGASDNSVSVESTSKTVTVLKKTYTVYGTKYTIGSKTYNIWHDVDYVSNVYGGYGYNKKKSVDATGNSVTINGGTLGSATIYGGYSVSGTAGGTSEGYGNTVTLGNNSVEIQAVYGGYGKNAIGNRVITNGYSGTVTGAYDGLIQFSVVGGRATDGAANSNAVEIGSGTYNEIVAGGYADGSATSNTVTLSGGNFKGSVYGGRIGSSGSASKNSVTISGANVSSASVFGGYTSGSGTVGSQNNGNSVAISAGSVTGGVYGGYAFSGGDVSYNRVSITGGGVSNASGTAAVYNGIYGGYSGSGAVSNNTVTIDGGNVSSDIYGGYAAANNALSNSVTVTSGSVTGAIYGGYGYSLTGDGRSQGNTVDIGSVSSNIKAVYGGYGKKANLNSVTVDGYTGTVAGLNGISLAGGLATDGYADKNTAKVKGGTYTGIVAGGYVSKGGNANENKLTIESGTFNGKVYGGYSYLHDAESNEVTITAGTFNEEVYGGYSIGDAAEDFAHKNNVTISGGAFTASIYGGYGATSATASENTVEISGNASVTSVYGGYSTGNTATGNTVTVNGGTFSGDVYGGCSTVNSVSGNKVNITAGTFNGNIYGGRSTFKTGSATNNTVTISGGNLSSADIYGGVASKSSSGNTLSITGKGITVNSVNNFQNYNFTIPQGFDKDNDVMLTISGETALKFASTDVITVDVKSVASLALQSSELKKRDKITLISTDVSMEGFNTVDKGSRIVKDGDNTYVATITMKKGSNNTQLVLTAGVEYLMSVIPSSKIDNKEVYVTSPTDASFDDGAQECTETLWKNAYGGYSGGSDTVSGNVIKFKDTAQVSESLYGGYSASGTVQSNTANLQAGTVGSTMYGGYSETGAVSGNTANITGGAVTSKIVYGGYSKSNTAGGTAAADGNKVTLNGSSVTLTSIYGGYSETGAVSYNSAEVIKGSVTTVYGGYTTGTGTVASNSATISGGSVSGNVYGGYSDSSAVKSNSVTITAGTLASFSIIYGGYSKSGTAGGDDEGNGNMVTLGGFSGVKAVYGGYGKDARGNRVTVSTGYTGTVSGDDGTLVIPSISLAGGRATNGSANKNEVQIDGGTYSKAVIGGYTPLGGNASNNKVTINAGTFSGSVYGGYSLAGGDAKDNTVTISGGNLSSADIYGGVATVGSTSSGNTLSVTAQGIQVNTINNFQNYNFTIPSGFDKDNDVMLTISGGLTGLTLNSTDTVSVTGLEIGDIITLVVSENKDMSISNFNKKVTSDPELRGVLSLKDNDRTLVVRMVGKDDLLDVLPTAFTGNIVNVTSVWDANFDGKDQYCTESVWRNAYGGYSSGSDTVSGNKITFSGTAEVSENLYGGYSASGSVQGNTVILEAGTVGNTVYGGYSNGGAVSGNTTSITGGVITSNVVYGGYGTAGVVNNKVKFESTYSGTIGIGLLKGSIYGGYGNGNSANVNKNEVSIASGTYTADIYGGYSDNGTVGSKDNGNSVAISAGSVAGGVYGGFASGSGAVSYNSVSISGTGSVSNSALSLLLNGVYGGYSTTGAVSNNGVNISGGNVSSDIYGGYAAANNALSNSVTVTSGTVTGAIYGGYVSTLTGDWKSQGNTVNVGSISSNIKAIYGGYGKHVVYNNVTVDGYTGTVAGIGGVSVAGGLATDGYADNSTVKVNGGIYTGAVAGGFAAKGGNANTNKLTIGSGTFNGKVYGGYSNLHDAESNEVTVTAGTFNEDVYGGYSIGDFADDFAQYNQVEISGGVFTAGIYGGYGAGEATANENTVEISGNTTSVKFVYGGYGQAATKNKVEIKSTFDGEMTGSGVIEALPSFSVVGGRADGVTEDSDANENEVEIGGGIYDGIVAGGYTRTGNAEDNIVKITNGTFKEKVYGGYSAVHDALNNEVTIENGTFAKEVYGGYSYSDVTSDPASKNKVTVNGGTFSADIYGGYSNLGYAHENDVKITGGKSGDKITIAIYGGYSETGTVKNNTLSITGGSYSANVWCGKSASTSTSAEVSGGTVTVGNTGTNAVINGNVIGGQANGGNASTNTVNVNGGKLNGSVYGGYSATGNATGNTVNVSGGEVTGNVYVGKSDSGTVSGNTLNWSGGTIKGSEIKGNTVNITGASAAYLGTTGIVTADSAVTLGNGTDAATFTVGNGTAASVLTFASGLDAKANSTMDIKTNSSVTLQGTSTAAGTVSGAGTLTNKGTLTAGLANLGDHFVNDTDATLKMNGDLIKDIAGAGTTILQENITVIADRNVEGTLDTNDKTIDMQEADAATYSTLTVGKLKGNSDLKIDVDLSGATAQSDSLIINSDSTGAVVNLTGINVRKDIGFDPIELPKDYTDAVTYVQGTVTGITYQLNGSTEEETVYNISTATNNYVYDFKLGSAGKLNYKVSAADVTFKKFIEGELEGKPATLSLTGNMKDDSANMGAAAQTNNTLNININGNTLGTAVGNTVTVGTKTINKIMNIYGGTTQGTVNTSWTVESGSTLNTSGLLKMEGSVTGGGTLTNTGTLDITADNLGIATTNTNGTINLGAGTLEKAITGGNINVTDAVTANAADLAGAVTIKNAQTLTLTGGDIAGNIGIESEGAKDGALEIKTGAVTNTAGKTVDVKDLIITSGSLKTDIAKVTVGNDISNAGTLILTDTTSTALNNNLTGAGKLQIGNGTAAVKITSAKTIANTVDVKANAEFTNTGTVSGNVTNAGTLTSSIDKLKGTITNNGTFNASGSLTKNISGTSGTTKIDSSLTANDSTTRTIEGTLALNGGTLNMHGSSVTVNTLKVGTLSGSGSIKFDVAIDGANLPTIDNITATNIIANTVLTLDSVTITGSSTEAQWGVGEDNKKIVTLVKNTNNLSNLTIAGTTTTATSDGYRYDFSENAVGSGVVKIVKGYAGTLAEIVQNITVKGYEMGKINTYDLATNYTEENDLGELKRVDSSIPRTFTINGKSHSFSGNSKQGIIVKEGDTLILNDISEISGWNGYVVDNAGTVNIGTTTTTALKSKLQGEGTYNLTGGTLKVEDLRDLAMTGITNNGTMELGNSTVATDDDTLTAVITGGAVKLAGNVSTAGENFVNNTGVDVATNTLTITSGNLGVEITGTTGKVVISDTTDASKAINTAIENNGTLTIAAGNVGGAVTNAGIVNLNAGTLAKAITGGTLNINGDVTAAANYIAGTTNVVATTLTLTDGALGGDLSGQGSVIINGTVTSDKNIANAVTINADKKFTTFGTITGTIVNKGTLNLNSAYTNETAIGNTGTLNVTAANLGADVTNTNGITNLGTGTLEKTITNGNINITGNVTTLGSNLYHNTIVVTSGNNLTLTSGTVEVGDTANTFALNRIYNDDDSINDAGTSISAVGKLTIDKATLVSATSAQIFHTALVPMGSEDQANYELYSDINDKAHSDEAKRFVEANKDVVPKGFNSNISNITFAGGSLQLNDSYYTLGYAESAEKLLRNVDLGGGNKGTTSLIMMGDLVQYTEQSQEVNKVIVDQIDDGSKEEEVITYDKVTAATMNGSLLVGSNDILSQTGAVDEVKKETDITIRDTSATSLSINQLNLQQKQITDTFDGVVITNDKSVTVGGSQTAEEKSAGKVTELMIVSDTEGKQIENNPLKVVVGLVEKTAETLGVEKAGTLNIGNKVAEAANKYNLNGSLLVNPTSQANVKGQTVITEGIELNGGSLAVAKDSVVTTNKLDVTKTDNTEASISGVVNVANDTKNAAVTITGTTLNAGAGNVVTKILTDLFTLDDSKLNTKDVAKANEVEVQAQTVRVKSTSENAEGSTKTEQTQNSTLTGTIKAITGLIVEKATDATGKVKDNATVVLNVGNDTGAGLVSAAVTVLNDGMLFTDPVWKDGGIENATNYATNLVNNKMDGAYVVGRNSVLTLGSSDTTLVKTLFDAADTQAQLGKAWSENGITAAAYIVEKVNLGTGSLTVDGSLNVAPESPAAGTLNLAANSLLMVDAQKFLNKGSDYAISGIKNLTVCKEEGKESLLFLQGAEKDDVYKILLGDKDSIKTTNTWSDAMIRTNAITQGVGSVSEDGSYYTITIIDKPYDFKDTVAPITLQAMQYADVNHPAHKYIGNVTSAIYTKFTQDANMNRMVNMPEELGVYHSHFTVTNMTEDAVGQHLALDQKKPGKDIWAVGFHSKETVDGLGLNNQGNHYSTQYNGAIVGVDLMDSNKATLGAAITYVTGKATAGYGSHNDSKYYGITLYGRAMLNKNTGVHYDVSYTNSSNDLQLGSGFGTQITGDQKVNSFSMGARIEKKFDVGATSFTPHAGARWMSIRGQSFKNNLGVEYNPDQANLLVVPVGLNFKASMENSGWKMSFLADGGYQWNLGTNEYKQNVSFNNRPDGFDVNFADKGNWYAGFGLEFNRKNFTATVGSKYMTGSHSNQHKWYAQMNWSF